MSVKLVLFDMGGVILPIQPPKQIGLYEKKLGLPRRFLIEVFLKGAPDNAFCKLERGEYTLTEFYPCFEAEVQAKAKLESVYLPESFSAKDLFASFSHHSEKYDGKTINSFPTVCKMLNASYQLRKNGISTCIITNNWIDDGDEDMKVMGQEFMREMKSYFNEVFQSAVSGTRKPEKKFYDLVCKRMGVRPQECAFLDDIGQNLKAAKEVGIAHCIKVMDPIKALEELQEVTGINLLKSSADYIFSYPCSPESVSHGYISIKPGVKIHFVESGDGPVVILLHGFPDFWYGWRHQIPALANAGYRAIALDQRGYGESSCPPNIEDYSQMELTGDIVAVMDKLGIAVATVIGHDWGGSLAWSLVLKYPDRFRAVCGVNTPFFRINPNKNPLESMRKNPGVFDYQLYFQEPGKAEREFEEDPRRTFSIFYQGVPPKSEEKEDEVKISASTSNVRARGGLFAGLPAQIPRSAFMTPFDLQYYADTFTKSGFRGGLNWYRNYEANWKWLSLVAHRKITMPALMVTASHDNVLKPEFSFGMEERVLNLKRLHIDRCSHWTMQEKPFELNKGLIKWLDDVHSKTVSSKL